MDRLERYHKGFKDDYVICELEKSGVDIEKYLEGSFITDIKINNKSYKIFYAANKDDLRIAITIIENDRLKKLAMKELNIEAIQTNKQQRVLKQLIENYVNKIVEEVNLTGDIVFDGKIYKKAPSKVGKPTDEKKGLMLNVRISDDQVAKLKKYCDRNKLNTSEAIRKLIEYCNT